MSADLAFGLGWHSAMDVVWKLISDKERDNTKVIQAGYIGFENKWCEVGLPDLANWDEDLSEKYNPRTPYTAIGMLEGYVGHRRTSIEVEYSLIHIERPFAVPIYPDRDDIWYCGRFDKVVRSLKDNLIYVIDHKTTSQYKRDGYFRSSFIDGFSPDSQMEGYAYAANLLWGKEFGGILIDAALVHKQVHEGFRYIPLLRSDESLDQWLWETRNEIELIQQYDKAVEWSLEESCLHAFPRNTQNCYAYSKPCTYLDLCKGWDNPIKELGVQGVPMGFLEETWEPFDVNHLEMLGMQR